MTLYELILEKRESAKNHIMHIKETKQAGTTDGAMLVQKLQGEIDAYTDILKEIERRHSKALKGQEMDYTGLDALEELKAFKLAQYDEKGYMLDYTTLEKVMPTEISFIERDLKAYEELKEQINQRGNE